MMRRMAFIAGAACNALFHFAEAHQYVETALCTSITAMALILTIKLKGIDYDGKSPRPVHESDHP